MSESDEVTDFSKGNMFIFSFTDGGFETIHSLKSALNKDVLDKLRGVENPNNVETIVRGLHLRGMLGQEGRLEVYILGADKDITTENLWEWAESDPQSLADALRDRGFVVVKGRSRRGKNRITR